MRTTTTIFRTVNVTTTLCPCIASDSAPAPTLTKYSVTTGPAAVAATVASSSFGANASPPTSTTTSNFVDHTSNTAPAEHNNSPTTSPDVFLSVTSPSVNSSSASHPPNIIMAPTLSSGLAAPTTVSAASVTGLIDSHTIAAVSDVQATTTTVQGNVPTCSMLPTAPITNEQQVGDSVLGSLCADNLARWLGDYDAAPWAGLTTSNSDATVMVDLPVTNVTREYDFTISRGRISADGVLRDVILINNQFPGPTIEANWGDWIQVTVHNDIKTPEEGTSLHWHGQLQRTTPWEDGVPSIGQCPIAPGHSFTYRFQAELHGTSWYHAHYSSQFTAGVVGALIVHGPTSMDYDVDVGPIMLTDWYHIPYFSIVENAVGTDLSVIPPMSDSVLINGRGRFDCGDRSYDSSSEWLGSNLESNITWTCVEDAPLAAFRFTSGLVHRLRLINHGANGVQKFSIDHHNLTIIATDYVPNVPYTTDVVTLGVGQRADVLVVAADTPNAAIWMRTSAPGGQPCGGANHPETKAAIYYEDADTSIEPTTTSSAAFNGSACVNDPLTLTTPDFAITPSNNTQQQDIGLALELNSTGNFEFQVNGQRYHANFNIPLMKHVQDGNMTFEPEWNVYNFGDSSSSVILNVTNNMPLTHPVSLHSERSAKQSS